MSSGFATSPQQAAASTLCASLHRAYRDLRFYPPDHPSARMSMESLTTALKSYVDRWGSLTLEVGEENLSLEGESVYSHAESRDNLAFLMFRDGIRSLTFHQGVESTEVESFVDCLAHADDLAQMEYDLVTALWERDYVHIDYRAADPFLGGEVLREGMVDALRDTVLRRLEEGPVPHEPGQAPRWDDLHAVEAKTIDRQALALTADELEHGERALEGLGALLEDFTEVLLEIAAGSPISSTEDILARAFPPVISAYIESGDVSGASFVLDQLQHMEDEGWCPSGFVGTVVAGAIGRGEITHLLRRLEQAPLEEKRRIEYLLRGLKKWITGPLLEVLAETQDRTTRKVVLDVLGAEGGVPWPSLEPLLRDQRWYVVRNAVQLAGLGEHVGLRDHWQHLLAHPDARVRRETLRALERLGEQGPPRAFIEALSDEDSSVRTLAARSLGRVAGGEQEAALLALIKDRNFLARPDEEVHAVLEAYAHVAQSRALPILEKLWKKKLLSSRPLAVRVAATSALGRIRAPEARTVLLELSKSGDPAIKRAALQALHQQAGGSLGGSS